MLCVSKSDYAGEMDFPGSPVVKNLPANAEDMGSIPGLEIKIPHATGRLSPLAPEPVF